MAHYRKRCVTVLLTSQCNLACSYCYIPKVMRSDSVIDVEFAKTGVADFFGASDQRHLRFYAAGEPTLAFDEMKEIHAFARSIAGNDLRTEVQTNGVFPDSVLSWLAENATIVWVSCDGPPVLHDQHRRLVGGQPSSAYVEKAILNLVETGACECIGVRATITEDTMAHQVDIVDYCVGLGVDAIYSDPVFAPLGQSGGERDLQFRADFLMQYAKEFVRAKAHATRRGIFYGSIFTVNFDEQTEIFCRSSEPCPHLTVDGHVSCCDMAVSADALPELVYGRYDPEKGSIAYDAEAIGRIRQRRAGNLRACVGCEVLNHCAGACFGEGLNETGALLGVKTEYCAAIRYLWQALPQPDGLFPHLHP